MNLINKAKEFASEQGGSNNNNNQQAQQGNEQVPQQGNAGNTSNSGSQDYGDKALDFVEKKSGHTFSRQQNEEVTDYGRNAYEKATGNNVDPKYSN
ncbi:hypothetical protein B7494_g7323 [Chlorociboria aeruginascens]|nr:hypothetical protein B7494_g7323 [Chlorociboria aeruginascens]